MTKATTRTMKMVQAMPRKVDVDLVTTFVGQLDAILDHNYNPFIEEVDDPDDVDAGEITSDQQRAELLQTVCERVIERGSLSRVVWAGVTALRGLCDHENDAVAVHPKIAKALFAIIAHYEGTIDENGQRVLLTDAVDAAREALKQIEG